MFRQHFRKLELNFFLVMLIPWTAFYIVRNRHGCIRICMIQLPYYMRSLVNITSNNISKSLSWYAFVHSMTASFDSCHVDSIGQPSKRAVHLRDVPLVMIWLWIFLFLIDGRLWVVVHSGWTVGFSCGESITCTSHTVCTRFMMILRSSCAMYLYS